MRKNCFILSILLAVTLGSFSQDSVHHRIILIGDAGEMDKAQQKLIPDAAGRIIPGKTTVLYLGDNIYPTGMALPGSKNREETEQILRSQFAPMRAKEASVYFVPGNHDWDKMGKQGLIKIQQQWQFLQDQNDSLLKLVPQNGCPDPYEINITDNLVIIAFDSEWWLYPFAKDNPGADCECRSKDEVLARMDELFYRNRYKMILLANHHPFQSYGTHGGYFSWKDHIFPLTAASDNLYIPLPIVGSLYPFLRKTFSNPEDTHHPLYKDMITRIDNIFNHSPNVVHLAGHEHGLQFIENPKTNLKQVVSGGGAKENHTIKGTYSLYGRSGQGYVIADWLDGNILRFTYYIYSEGVLTTAFTHRQPLLDVKPMQDSTYASIKGDSINVQVRPEYDKVSKFQRALFGENYRKEFAAPTKLPVIRISQIHSGLIPEKRGGGMQTVSLRLKDKEGNEWALRNLEKNPDPLLPETLRQTFARDLLDDYMSAQHPFAPLVVPVLANAANVPHANPIIGVVAPDSALGMYEKLFANKVALLEEREPLGKSDNTPEMQENMQKDNDNDYDARTFLRARLLDLLISDWDRHADQWRWVDKKKGKEKYYEPVPRDRDQALYKRQGYFPGVASRAWILPTLQGYDGEIKRVKYSLLKTNFVNAYMSSQFSHDEWMKITNQFVKNITDSVIETAFHKLPASAYQIRGEKLTSQMKERRNNIPKAMDEFYSFINKRVDIAGTDKNELFEIKGTPNGGLTITGKKINKDGVVENELFTKTYEPSLTKEVRLYLFKGADSVVLNNSSSRIKLRMIGGDGHKSYNVIASKKKARLYEKENTASFTGETQRLKKHISNDSLNTSFVPVNLYNITMPLISAGYNLDDGVLIGLGFKHTHQGFRKVPYASEHQLVAAHSFSTKAYRIRYRAEWIQVVGKADLTLQAIAKAPDNTQNYFGRGNETVFDKTGDYKKFYRTRFAIYQADPALRWRGNKSSSFSIGPSIQYYRYSPEDNIGRFTEDPSNLGTYDSSSIDKEKAHLGLVMNFINDTRSNKLFPAWGSYVNIRVQGYAGLGKYAENFLQIIPEVSLYKSLNSRRTIILSDRLGGGISFGKTTFYQSQFIGGHENLLGYRQYRFAGQHSMYNNLELRMKLADFANYVLPGQLGMILFYDTGRVWEKGETSHLWHNGLGGGLYLSPATMAVFQAVVGFSKEGVYPYFTMNFRF